MSTPIEQNTTDLRRLLELALNLPDAGSTPANPVLQNITITQNGEYEADEGYDGLGVVNVNVPIPSGYIKPSGTKTVTENGTYDIESYASVFVNIATSGGSLPERITALTTGEYIPSSDITGPTEIQHNLGVSPNFFLWFMADNSPVNPITNVAIYGGVIKRHTEVDGSVKNELLWFSNGLNSSSSFGGTQGRVSNTTTYYLTDTEVRIGTNSTYAIKSGCKYYWVCGAIDNVT